MTYQRKREPLVSVVVPVYNGEHYVRESMDSVLAQTYPHIEVVIVDDASSDGTPAAIAPYVDGERVRCIRNESNRGQFGAVNRGLVATDGDLVAVHHADDLMFPRRVELQVAWLSAHREVGTVFATDVFIDAVGRAYGRPRLPAEFRDGGVFGYRDVLNGVLRYGNVFLRAPTNLVRRRLYDEVGLYSEEWALRGDIEMWLRLSRAAPVGILAEPLVAYRYGHDNESARYERRRTELELTFELLDRILDSGDRRIADSEALRGFEGRRAEDLLIVSANRYVAGDIRAAKTSLARSRPRRIMETRVVRRGRLLVLWAALHVFLRLPRIAVVAGVLERRSRLRLSRGRA